MQSGHLEFVPQLFDGLQGEGETVPDDPAQERRHTRLHVADLDETTRMGGDQLQAVDGD